MSRKPSGNDSPDETHDDSQAQDSISENILGPHGGAWIEEVPGKHAGPKSTVEERQPRPSQASEKLAEWTAASFDSQTTHKAPSKTMIPLSESRAMRQPLDSRLLRSSFRRRSPWSASILLVACTCAAFFILYSILQSFVNRQLEPPGGCIGPRMRPSYLKFTGFDTEHTRFASKYSLYLYREDLVDEYSEDNIGVSFVTALRNRLLTQF